MQLTSDVHLTSDMQLSIHTLLATNMQLIYNKPIQRLTIIVK